MHHTQSEQQQWIHHLLGELAQYEVLASICVGHSSYVVVRHWGLVKYIGLDQGQPKLFDRAYVEGLLLALR
jgi:hypothetical protein